MHLCVLWVPCGPFCICIIHAFHVPQAQTILPLAMVHVLTRDSQLDSILDTMTLVKVWVLVCTSNSSLRYTCGVLYLPTLKAFHVLIKPQHNAL